MRRQSGEVDIGSALLFDEISGYCHPQPGSRLLTYGKYVYLLLYDNVVLITIE